MSEHASHPASSSSTDASTAPSVVHPIPPDIRDRALRRVIFSAGLVVIFAGIKTASGFIVPILIGCFLAIITWPLVALVRRTRLPDGIGIFLVLTVISGLMLGVGAAVVASATSFIQNSDKYAKTLTERFSGLIHFLSEQLGTFGYAFNAKELQSQLDPGMLFGQLSTVLSGVGAAVSGIFYVLILLSFIIVEIAILPRKLETITTSEGSMRRFGDVIAKVQTYILVKTGLSIVTALVTGAVTFAVGVPYAGLWMLLTFVLNYVPAFGSILAAIPPIILALLLVSWQAAVGVGAVYLAANFLIGNMLEPRLMGRTLGLSPLIVIVSLVFWGWIFGPIGMVLSTPLTMIVKIMLADSEDFGWIAVLLGSGDDELPTDAHPEEQIPAMRFVSMAVRSGQMKVDPEAAYKPGKKEAPLEAKTYKEEDDAWPEDPDR